MVRKRSKRQRASNFTRRTVAASNGKSAFVKSVVIVGILLGALVAFGAYVSRPTLNESASTGRTTTAPLPTPQYAANAPAKEYVYAGSKLIAVTEPVQPAPNDLAVWRLSTGVWYVKGPTGTLTTATWGVSTDKATPGDYDGDGKTDFCIYRPDDDGSSSTQDGKWYMIMSATSTIESHFYGETSDTPVAADFDGDGRTDYALYRSTTQTWYIKSIASGTMTSVPYGDPGDTPVQSDFDGDGKADIALWRDSDATWYVLNSGSDYSETTYQWGSSGDLPVPGDYDGDFKTDYAVWKTNDTWTIRKSSDGTTMGVTTWGDQGSDYSVQGDYDGDGKTDRAVWRPSNGTWYILQSGNGYTRSEVWGQSGDFPVPAPYRR